MKKLKFLSVFLFVILVVSGCGNTKVLSCSGTSPGTNMNAASKVKYTFKSDKLTKTEVEVKFQDITVDNLSSVWDTFKEQFTEQNKPVKETGFERSVKADDKNYTFSVIMKIDFTKISKATMEKYGIEDYSTKTYDEIKEETLSDGSMTCN